MTGISENVARSAMRIASYKMPIKTQFVIANPVEKKS
jgi:ribosomal protein L16/L10AE